jgi:hypothetical protein
MWLFFYKWVVQAIVCNNIKSAILCLSSTAAPPTTRSSLLNISLQKAINTSVSSKRITPRHVPKISHLFIYIYILYITISIVYSAVYELLNETITQAVPDLRCQWAPEEHTVKSNANISQNYTPQIEVHARTLKQYVPFQCFSTVIQQTWVWLVHNKTIKSNTVLSQSFYYSNHTTCLCLTDHHLGYIKQQITLCWIMWSKLMHFRCRFKLKSSVMRVSIWKVY